MTDYLRLINSCAMAGGPSPIEFVPMHEYHPASSCFTAGISYFVETHPAQAAPGISTPLNCHLCAVVGGLPIVLQVKVALAPAARVRFCG